LNLAETDASEAVELAATNSALDRSGLTSKTGVEVEVSTKPFELVFDKIMNGPQHPAKPAALEIENLDNAGELGESDDGVIVGEYDDDPLPEGDEIEGDPLGNRRERKSAGVIDVEVAWAASGRPCAVGRLNRG
jgi:hypothetical protein